MMTPIATSRVPVQIQSFSAQFSMNFEITHGAAIDSEVRKKMKNQVKKESQTLGPTRKVEPVCVCA